MIPNEAHKYTRVLNELAFSMHTTEQRTRKDSWCDSLTHSLTSARHVSMVIELIHIRRVDT